jgi:60 kDa SS-A/Ro ribonucleoprotein
MARNDVFTRAAGPRLATDPIPGTIPNHDGGAVFALDDLAVARRFLIIGTSGGTYYQTERDITRENADVIRNLAATKPEELVELIADVSERGLAPKVDPQLFALAMCTCAPGAARAAAYREFGRVIRTGSHLLMWARYHKALGGGVSRSWRRAVNDWYHVRDVESLAYQMAKYRSRDGWSQRDLIDLSHALSGGETRDMARGRVLRWARGETMMVSGSLPPLIRALEETNDTGKLIAAGASWEMLPDAALTKPETWAQLIAARKLPMGAMLRQLSRMTQVGVFDEYFANETASAVKAFFDSEESLRRARLHPLNILLALRQYGQGSRRSGGTFRPNMGVAAMLNQAFYKAFETAPASGKRTLVGVDVSPSMGGATPIGLTSYEIAMVMGMKIIASEPASSLVGFANGVTDLGIHKLTTLENAMEIARVQGRSWSATNPAALIQFAAHNKIEVDTFVVITDNEVNQGIHVPDALRAYRRLTGIDAKLAVLATTATNFSIADPKDPGMLDIAGFGADVPALLTEFSRGF